MKDKIKTILLILLPLILGAAGGATLTATLTAKTPETVVETKIEYKTNPQEATLELSEEPETTLVENDLGEVEEADYPTVESVDGGMFEDELTGLSSALTTAVYNDLGAIESVDTSSPEAFRASTLGRCIIANNFYGAQCVSLARAFWWDYAGRDVSTCGTGLAKGMMNCAEQNAGDDFEIIYNRDEIIKGTWIVTDGTYTGHICMALSAPNANGYIACLGENQGGASCGQGIGGSATNIINLSTKNFIGGYIPKTYIPAPEPEPELPATSAGF